MSVAVKATKSLDMLAAALHGLDAIAELAKAGGSQAVPRLTYALDIIAMIERVVDSIRNGFDGKIDPASIHAELLKLRTNLLANDAKSDSDLDAKFPR